MDFAVMNTLYDKQQKQFYIMGRKEIILYELSAMGFDPVSVGEVGYAFQYEDMDYIYMPDEDEQFLRMVIPNLFEVTDDNRLAVLDAISETESLLKYAKVCIIGGNVVWAMYDHHLNSTDNLTGLLEHIINVLGIAAIVFGKKINGEDVNFGAADGEDSSDDELESELLKLLDGIDVDEVAD